nr:MAG TPA: hypothetical protein [Caudoviricetes sp.]
MTYLLYVSINVCKIFSPLQWTKHVKIPLTPLKKLILK